MTKHTVEADKLASQIMSALCERHEVLAKGYHEPVYGKKVHIGDRCIKCGTNFAALRDDIEHLVKYYIAQATELAKIEARIEELYSVFGEVMKGNLFTYYQVDGDDVRRRLAELTQQKKELESNSKDYKVPSEDSIESDGDYKVESVNRLEVIDSTGRAYVKGDIYGTPVSVKLRYQDGGKTLKVFVKDKTV